MNEKFALFTETVDKHFRSFVNQLHEYLTENVFCLRRQFGAGKSRQSCDVSQSGQGKRGCKQVGERHGGDRRNQGGGMRNGRA